jgi:hypothetical protein
MKTILRNVLAVVAVWLAPSVARAQTKEVAIPTLGAPGFVALGVVLGIAGLVTMRRRRR